MKHYDITVLYGCRSSGKHVFPKQTFPSDRIEFLYIPEDDPYHPHQNALSVIGQVHGRYLIMLDEGDDFPDDFLEKMFASAQEENCAFAMPACSSPLTPTSEERFTLRNASDGRIDTADDPQIFPVELHGLMIRTDRLHAAFTGQTSYSCELEKRIILSLLEEYPTFFYVASRPLTCAVSRECDNRHYLQSYTREWYFKPFEEFLLPLLEEEKQRSGQVRPLLQYLALYMNHMRLFANMNNRNKGVILREEVLSYMKLLTRVLQYVEVKYIVSGNCQPASASNKNKLFDLRIRRNNYAYYPELLCETDTVRFVADGWELSYLEKVPVRINLIDYKNGCLEIDGGIEDCFSSSSAAIYAKFDGKRYPLVYNQRYSLTKCFGVTYSRLKIFHVSVPVADSSRERLLTFLFTADGMEYQMDYAFPSHTSRFSKDFVYGYWQFGKYLSFYNKEGIHVRPSSKMLVLRKEVLLWKQMWQKKNGVFRPQLPLKILNFLLRPYFSRQKIWLFFDKIYKGGDSSEYIFRYAQKQEDGIKKYYLLDKKSADYKRMRREGYRPLIRGSLKHRLIFLNADMIIASNSTVFAFNDYTFERSLPIRGDVHFDVACVQHGMSVQKIALAQQRLRDNTKLYFCASKYEIENLSKPVYDYAGYDILKLTGVPRYDGLEDRSEKIILLSPTWRMNSAMPVTANEGVSRDYNPNFKDTDYYKVYNSLINNPRLLDAAREYGYRIQYVLHPIVSPQAKDFTKNRFVEIIPSIGDVSYEKLFCEASLMVTDFSGVQFDFAYMRKPVVYLHHNDIPQHYEEGTFHYTTMGFGEICHTNDELIDVLCDYMKKNCQMPEVYRKRADDFFHYSDHKNCERIYPIMLEHTKSLQR